jgi:4-hydroxy-tetrahydrodipicolinate synthase
MGHYFTGVLTEIITPFNEDGSIDYMTAGELIDFQLESGITNFFVNGLGAECHELSTDEKLSLLKVVYEHTKGKAKIMACSFENDLPSNKKLLDLYAETGMCDAFCITAPPFFRHSQKALIDYCGQLIDYAKKPVYIYNCVQMGTLFAPETIATLQKEHTNFRGYKDATVNVVHWIQTSNLCEMDNFDFLGGCDGLDGVYMTLGAVGCVSFMAVPFPKEMKAITDSGLAGDYKNCLDAQRRVMIIRNALKLSPFNAAYMYAQKFTGGPIVLHSRMPADQDFVSDEAKEVIDRTMKELGY